MEAYMDACDLWEAVEEDYEIPPLPGNPTLAQIKNHKEKKTRNSKAKASLYDVEEYQGDERIRGMKVLNLVREFEIQRMKESETIKEYSDSLISLANKVRLLNVEFSNNRIVQKILVTLPEKFEATIASLDNAKNLSRITLAELLNALQAQEQKRLMRDEGTVEGALQARQQSNSRVKGKKQKGKKNNATSTEAAISDSNTGSSNKGGKYPPCQHCGKRNHPHFKCWRKPDMRCRKCHKLGHAEKICKEKATPQSNEAQITDQ
ncbi:uncharacterized protein LOC131177990 [Hevea brasiliensis]|uniref:uncharacterized protein LOC131177990 n=1 Tax=Hevea brasiliensis TaxID=3981 RepID=UPI0025EEB300|nr:uncharacterized protein LOC131177990 [Hevea brasiliensis]